MIPKQDRQGVRKAMDIEQKYDLNTDFSEIEKIATDAKATASAANTRAKEARMAVDELADSTEAQFNEVNANITELGQSVEIHSENIINLDERLDTLENSGVGGGGGADGFSPIVELSKTGDVTTLKITDKNGTKTATIEDGKDGKDGQPGESGVYVGTEPPTNPSVRVWINPSGSAITHAEGVSF